MADALDFVCRKLLCDMPMLPHRMYVKYLRLVSWAFILLLVAITASAFDYGEVAIAIGILWTIGMFFTLPKPENLKPLAAAAFGIGLAAGKPVSVTLEVLDSFSKKVAHVYCIGAFAMFFIGVLPLQTYPKVIPLIILGIIATYAAEYAWGIKGWFSRKQLYLITAVITCGAVAYPIFLSFGYDPLKYFKHNKTAQALSQVETDDFRENDEADAEFVAWWKEKGSGLPIWEFPNQPQGYGFLARHQDFPPSHVVRSSKSWADLKANPLDHIIEHADKTSPTRLIGEAFGAATGYVWKAAGSAKDAVIDAAPGSKPQPAPAPTTMLAPPAGPLAPAVGTPVVSGNDLKCYGATDKGVTLRYPLPRVNAGSEAAYQIVIPITGLGKVSYHIATRSDYYVILPNGQKVHNPDWGKDVPYMEEVRLLIVAGKDDFVGELYITRKA